MVFDPELVLSVITIVVLVIAGFLWLAISIYYNLKKPRCPICNSELSHTIYRKADRTVIRICLNPSCTYSKVVHRFD